MRQILACFLLIGIVYQASSLSLVAHLETFEDIKSSLKVLGKINGKPISVSKLTKFRAGEVETLNRLRALHGVPPVKLDKKITAVSQAYAEKLFT